MAETIDTYFDAWNASDDAERRTLIERCLTSDVELIDENGRFSGHDGLASLMANFHQNVPGGRIVKTSGFDEFEGTARRSVSRRSHAPAEVVLGGCAGHAVSRSAPTHDWSGVKASECN